MTDELRALLNDILEYLGDQPARRDALADALYRRVLRMLAEGEPK